MVAMNPAVLRTVGVIIAHMPRLDEHLMQAQTHRKCQVANDA